VAEARFARRVPERPLSPHLQVYRWTWTMAMSIAHRISGVAAYFAAPLIVVWLMAAGEGADAYARFAALAASPPGVLTLAGLSWAVIHHAIGGVRHMVWDAAIGMDREARNLWAQGTLVGSVVLTAAVWLAILTAG